MDVDVWLVAAIGLVLGLVPCGVVCFRSSPSERLVALELGGTLYALVLLLLAEAFNYDPFFDLSVTVALLTLAGGLVFAHFLERWV
ncbi:MAG: monovalent cation/H+ antiporter complex subunit F [Actinomycetota bacterium]|nr:monovalent cation/H+ antiporter complex subunit F [Actinomycetota bacterium]